MESQRVLAGFRGTVPPIRPSIGYRFAVVGAAAVMLLMPVVYAALVGGVVWGIWLYLTRFDFFTVSEAMGGSASPAIGFVLLPAWLLPPALASIVLICLVKPLFVRMRAGEGGLRL